MREKYNITGGYIMKKLLSVLTAFVLCIGLTTIALLSTSAGTSDTTPVEGKEKVAAFSVTFTDQSAGVQKAALFRVYNGGGVTFKTGDKFVFDMALSEKTNAVTVFCQLGSSYAAFNSSPNSSSWEPNTWNTVETTVLADFNDLPLKNGAFFVKFNTSEAISFQTLNIYIRNVRLIQTDGNIIWLFNSAGKGASHLTGTIWNAEMKLTKGNDSDFKNADLNSLSYQVINDPFYTGREITGDAEVVLTNNLTPISVSGKENYDWNDNNAAKNFSSLTDGNGTGTETTNIGTTVVLDSKQENPDPIPELVAVYDLGQYALVSRFWHLPDATGHGMLLEGSLDGENWILLDGFLDSSWVADRAVPHTIVRYVRITFTTMPLSGTHRRLRIREIRLFGYEVDQGEASSEPSESSMPESSAPSESSMPESSAPSESSMPESSAPSESSMPESSAPSAPSESLTSSTSSTSSGSGSEPANYAIKVNYSFTSQDEGDQKFLRLSLYGQNGLPYTAKEGDKLVYDVAFTGNKVPGIGSMSIQEQSAWKLLPDLLDQNGRPTASGADLTKVAFEQWYHREIEIPSTFADKNICHWFVVLNTFSGGSGATAYYRDIKVVDADGNIAFVVFDSENSNSWSPSKMKEMPNDTKNATFTTELVTAPDYPVYDPSAAEPDDTEKAIKLQVTVESTEEGDRKFGRLSLYGLNNLPYTFDMGDKLVYDVALEQRVAGLGGINIQENGQWALMDAGDHANKTDQHGKKITPSEDLSDIAFKTWYHREINIPSNLVFMNAAHWFLEVNTFDGLTSDTIVAYFKNIKIVRADGTEFIIFDSENNSTGFVSASAISKGSANIARMIATVVDAPDYDSPGPEPGEDETSEPDDEGKSDEPGNADTSDKTIAIYLMVALIAVSIVTGKLLKDSVKIKG